MANNKYRLQEFDYAQTWCGQKLDNDVYNKLKNGDIVRLLVHYKNGWDMTVDLKPYKTV